MDVKVDKDKIKALRVVKSWSQEMLAEEADLSLRTIQRMELDGSASLKSRLAVAQALGVEPAALDPIANLGDGQGTQTAWPATSDPAQDSSPQAGIKGSFSYPGSYSMSSRILTPLLVVLWTFVVITGGLLLVITLPMTLWNMVNTSETLTHIILAQLPLLVVFVISVCCYLFFRRFRPRTS